MLARRGSLRPFGNDPRMRRSGIILNIKHNIPSSPSGARLNHTHDGV
ncbi:hypothetical protein SPAB_03586 [Salmonella enterica subsp. enterica serovar Paratyphi B str. SPB7]|uniref:Uncharacterized protein n=1 Tax=Salmonella paratyphi B (strain ATCC BAA-1250 / SPB7) TaxID=1016998 RepID=A0A6C6Z5X9_SALPB|nr:hypothetical protein SPAB_03586 [Salmonella enterica subsp. enterica serovar Paratyphi B str. SPB7]